MEKHTGKAGGKTLQIHARFLGDRVARRLRCKLAVRPVNQCDILLGDCSAPHERSDC